MSDKQVRKNKRKIYLKTGLCFFVLFVVALFARIWLQTLHNQDDAAEFFNYVNALGKNIAASVDNYNNWYNETDD